jgi:LPXTG-motif cell wall-anchored protein
MRNTMKRRMTVVALLALALTTLLAGAAVAQETAYDPDVADFELVCTPDVVALGGTVTCRIVGAVPGEVLDWTAACEPGGVFASGMVTADSPAGRATFSFEVPDSCEGPITVEVLSDIRELAITDSVRVRFAPPPDPGRPDPLPRTGADTALALAGGLLLIGLGGAAVASARRRDRSRVGA